VCARLPRRNRRCAAVNAILMAVLAAAGFAAASLLALLGGELGARGRSFSAAFAAGILLALAFVDLFPEGLELAGETAVAGFVAGFALLFLTEVLTRAHTHHLREEHVNKHALGPFVLGLAIHNLADGFVLGVGAKGAAVASWLVGLGVLVHQVPVGISLAAVLLAARVGRAGVVRTATLLGLAIPAAATLTAAFPVPGEGTLGLLTGVAGGALAYIGATHLLPEAQVEHTDRFAGLVFVATLVVTAAGLIALQHLS
jgi:zinc and cadmium transporter